MTEWLYIANVVFRMYKTVVNKVTFVGLRGGGDRPNRPPLISAVEGT